MGIRDLVQRPGESLRPDASCAEAARVMRDQGIGSVVVAEDARPLGIVTDRDLATRVMAEDGDAREIAVVDVMSKDPIFVRGDRSISEAIAAMAKQQVRRMLIVDADGHLEGVVSLDDLVALLAGQLCDLSQTLEVSARECC